MTQSPHSPIREYFLVGLIALFAATAWSIANGRDLNWDFLNYHVYAGYAADGSRLQQDYFPASIQSYMLGYAYVPLAYAVQAGWNATAIQLLLAAQSVPTIVACWFLAVRLLPQDGRRRVVGWRIAMVLVACVSPLFLAELGTSFADAPTAALLLFAAGLLLPAADGRETGGSRSAALAGALVGVACALKMSNAPMIAGSVAVCLLYAGRDWRARVQATAAFILAAGVLFVVVYGWWGLQLYRQFGNPFFPLLGNEFFRPSEYFPDSVVLDRFKPISWHEFLLRPLYMLDPVANMYTETRAPDGRYLALLCLAIAYVCVRRKTKPRERRALDASLTWVAITWVAWLFSSGNGRYAIPLAMFAGAVCIALWRLLWRSRSTSAKALHVLCFSMLFLQVLSLVQGTTFRWDGRDVVSNVYFAPEVPSALVKRPHVVLNLESQSVSWLAPFVHRETVLLSPVGQLLIKPGTPAGRQMDVRLRSGLPVLVSFRTPLAAGESVVPSQTRNLAELFGLQIATESCERVIMDRSRALDSWTSDPAPTASVIMLCPAKYDAALQQRQILQFGREDQVLDHLEDLCPRLFKPARPQTVCIQHLCARNYVNTDLTLMAYADGGLVSLGMGGVQPSFIGYKREVLAGDPVRCPGRPGRYIPFSAGASVMARPD